MSAIPQSIMQFAGFGQDEESKRVARRRMQMVDELRGSCSGNVWRHFADYAKAKLDACNSVDALESTFKDLKEQIGKEQGGEDETTRRQKDLEKQIYQDKLELSAAAQGEMQVVAIAALNVPQVPQAA